VLERVYDPNAYAARLGRLATLLDRSGRPREIAEGDRRRERLTLDFVYGTLSRVPEAREAFWEVFKECRKSNPGALVHIMSLMVLYIHLGPFSRFVIKEIDRRIEALEAATLAVARSASASAVALA
jgi:hypothetical protein